MKKRKTGTFRAAWVYEKNYKFHQLSDHSPGSGGIAGGRLLHLPEVVMEGRKVVNNVTRTAGVFFIKTIYSLLVSIFCVIANIPFLFIPIQITLVDAFIEAYPSFVTIAEIRYREAVRQFFENSAVKSITFWFDRDGGNDSF